jgi:hypothetical protein
MPGSFASPAELHGHCPGAAQKDEKQNEFDYKAQQTNMVDVAQW